jgi:hypothetical protein
MGDVGLACDCDAMSKKLEEDKVAADKIRLDSTYPANGNEFKFESLCK